MAHTLFYVGTKATALRVRPLQRIAEHELRHKILRRILRLLLRKSECPHITVNRRPVLPAKVFKGAGGGAFIPAAPLEHAGPCRFRKRHATACGRVWVHGIEGRTGLADDSPGSISKSRPLPPVAVLHSA